MFMKYRGGRYYLFAVGSVLLLFFVLTCITQVLPTPPTPYDPAYYGWSNTLSGRRVLAVLNTDLNPCALERKKTIVVETIDTVTETVSISAEPTPSLYDIALTLDPSGHTTIIARPLETKYALIKYDLSVNKFWRETGCQNARFGSMFYISVTTPLAPLQSASPTPSSPH